MKLFLIVAVCSLPLISNGQGQSRFVPAKIDVSTKYVFYLHGRIVQEQETPVHPEYGLYDYPAIVKTLQRPGHHLITERRKKGTEIETYAAYVAKQIDTLISKGVSPERIFVVGASMGAGIATGVARLVMNKKVNYAVLAFCSDDVFTYVKDNNVVVCGNFLSIYEASDAAGSCDKLFLSQTCKTGYKEVRLDMKNKHGFIYKPYKQWVDPLFAWINKPL